MGWLDWTVMIGTLLAIAAYGTWRTRHQRTVNDYLRGGGEMRWFTIGLSVMATQASAITFLSAPGLGYESGLRFVQFYFGLPLALVLIAAFFIPIYYRLRVYTAYEYLEQRFDLRTRLLAASLFLIQRGLAAGLTIFAPAIVLSSLLGWDLNFTNLFVGILVIVYTVSGGTRAVSVTQRWQMGVIFLGMVLAFGILVYHITQEVSMPVALELAGTAGRMQVLDFSFDLDQRYTLWTGLTGGLFLALSYFGTDQSQVQRYLTGRNVRESRLGLMFNAALKIPMQFFILFTGVLVFIFYLYQQPPLFFNEVALERLEEQGYGEELDELQGRYDQNYQQLQEARQLLSESYVAGGHGEASASAKSLFREQLAEDQQLRQELKNLLLEADPEFKVKDTNYVFLTFVMEYLPAGVVGLILALIFSAAMSSTSSELNALSTTSSIDLYRRLFNREVSEAQHLRVSRWLTLLWGSLAIGFALTASLFDNLIEMVNLLGSLFYGSILGIFIVAFFLRWIKGRAVFWAALVGEAAVLLIHFGRVWHWEWLSFMGTIGYLWYNVIGCGLVVLTAVILQAFGQKRVS
ncbi:MAG: sodium:solute symporter [Schleiferiaceae bacterium]|nr:sodium:solute symporter [Schleiferiaceae bacterium]